MGKPLIWTPYTVLTLSLGHLMYLTDPTPLDERHVVGLLTELRQNLLHPPYVLAIVRASPFPVTTMSEVL